jgi:hypothetical protein
MPGTGGPRGCRALRELAGPLIDSRRGPGLAKEARLGDKGGNGGPGGDGGNLQVYRLSKTTSRLSAISFTARGRMRRFSAGKLGGIGAEVAGPKGAQTTYCHEVAMFRTDPQG